ncbi:NAD(P)-binding domain protein [Acididesulfobacillus acetoxydans]|uniref:Capsular polysaccharide biosynthesis protein CapD n=1 Tax=Acididesulfobacillus acetoxydans TaxID=1561005 RepID=A0A8S0W1N8_9FIRM|nr:nucleoside-diphosphate sugar epimerase/dehydratase [Acididesulfobacillus acetoxydans]CAA7599638.1 NAD(P)-binding domain protein [Acididesulfobacillus acetoxydans]CEJ06190.1 Capsular polysaccharide biosynthesis protein CapD [Acididesulfobacillus acetoxydans]
MILRKRTLLLMLIDVVLVNLAAFLSFYIRFEGTIPGEYYLTLYHTAWAATLISLAVFYVFGLYNRLWQYASTGELLSILFAVTVSTLATVTAVFFLAPMRLPHSVAALLWFTTVLLVGGSRFTWRIVLENIATPHVPGSQKQVLIVGAGDAGVLTARELKNHNFREGRPVGFIDDDRAKQRLHLMGMPILGMRKDIPKIVKNYSIDEVIIAMPSASGDAVRDIVQICEKTGVGLKIMPGVYDMLSDRVNTAAIRQVQVEDLLGREPVSVDLEEVSGYLSGETILVTGGGGSIGSEICRQVAKFSPGKLVIAGHGENTVFDIEQELRSEYPELELATEILDIKDREKVGIVFQKYRPGVIYHAAAHKHVPLMEKNPEEALKNNIVGTNNLVEAADAVGVKTFVMISTDKAVNPTSVMGTTKRVGEMIIQSMDKRSGTKFVAVRFGNVLGSRGSVIPTFKRQIAKGGPVTVTHPEMVRFFMTIPEAAQLVIQAGAMARGGEIFILDMGKPVKILDLARDLIRLSGFEPDVDIPIKFTGMRPGEKLYEELLTAEEGTSATKHKRIFVAKPNTIDVKKLQELIQTIKERGSYMTKEEVVGALQTVVPTFRKSAPRPALRVVARAGGE